jgi:predicted nucleic acid-binding protein
MRLVVADTSPLNYLILIEQAGILSILFERVFVPAIVRDELQHDEAPAEVRRWISHPPVWLDIVPVTQDSKDADLASLDLGERAAILLASQIRAHLLLMDDREGVNVARSRGFAVTGTLGVLDLAASRGLIDIRDAIGRLRNTSFRVNPGVLDALLARYPPEEEGSP